MMPLLTKREVAALLHVSTKTVDKLCTKRLLPFHLVESRKRFTYADLDAYLDNRRFGQRQSVQAPQDAR